MVALGKCITMSPLAYWLALKLVTSIHVQRVPTSISNKHANLPPTSLVNLLPWRLFQNIGRACSSLILPTFLMLHGKGFLSTDVPLWNIFYRRLLTRFVLSTTCDRATCLRCGAFSHPGMTCRENLQFNLSISETSDELDTIKWKFENR